VPPAEPLTVIERELALLLRRAASFSARLARDLHPDLDAPAYSLLMWLSNAGEARLTDLANAFGVGKATLSRQVQLLERLDLITREPDPSDGRSQLLRVTPSAGSRLRRIRQDRQQLFHRLLEPWPAAEVEQLGQLLGKFNTVVGTIFEEST
jgi:DNA-binding MarR family transcriptional regulator